MVAHGEGVELSGLGQIWLVVGAVVGCGVLFDFCCRGGCGEIKDFVEVLLAGSDVAGACEWALRDRGLGVVGFLAWPRTDGLGYDVVG
jgi:hypothetical protein